MTAYPALSLVFLAAALAVLAAALIVRRRRSQRNGPWLAVLLLAVVVLIVLTAIFDNLMIAVGLMTYASDRMSGVMIGRAPVEDLAYPVAAAMLLPALWTLIGGERSHDG